jgi:hypothetical protein
MMAFKNQLTIDNEMIAQIQQTRWDPPGALQTSRHSNRKHSDYSRQASSIDWSNYHMVISINTAVSAQLRLQCPKTVWVCMPGEGILPKESLGWDYYATHNCPASPIPNGCIIDLPYTFLRPNEIQAVINELGLGSATRNTIYLEVNSCPVDIRPPTFADSVHAQALQTHMGLSVRIHPNTMIGHLQELASAKYFVKTGGRSTRGNSILEAISAGVVVLIRPEDCFGNIGLPVDSYFSNFNDLLKKLHQLDV